MAEAPKKLDPELETEAGFTNGVRDDPDRVVDSESLGARHRRRFGYTDEGAQENDKDILDKGRKPQKIAVHRAPKPVSRTVNFQHGMTPHHLTTVQTRKRVSTI